MTPRIATAVLPAGAGPCQDRCVVADGLAIVLDGASAYDSDIKSGAVEYVDTLGTTLRETILDAPGVDLVDALAEAIGRTARLLDVVPGSGPSSTVSIVRWVGGILDVLVLGDSPVVVGAADGSTTTIEQRPMDHIAADLRRLYRERLAEGHGYDDAHRALLARIQRHEAPLRNVPGGYWIAEGTPEAAGRSSLWSSPDDHIAWAVACTDGAARTSSFLGHEPGALVTASPCDLESFLRRLTAWEAESDPDGVALPRSKRHDDKTVAVLTR